MDPNSLKTVAAAAGAGDDKIYINDVFKSTTYHGTDSEKVITTGIDVAGEGGMVLIKRRTTTNKDWFLSSTETAATTYLRPNEDAAEATEAQGIKSFSNTGFTVGTNGRVNADGSDFSAYTFRKCENFFDCGRYTGNNTNHRQIAHNLGGEPDMIWIKNVTSSGDWIVYNNWIKDSSPHTEHMHTNNSVPKSSPAYMSSGPTSTHFTVTYNYEGAGGEVNSSGETYEYYMWRGSYPGSWGETFGKDGDAGIQRFNRYEGSSSAQHIDVGWEPQFVLIKNVDDSADDWIWIDNQSGGGGYHYTKFKYLQGAHTEQSVSGGSATRVWFTNKGFYLPNGNVNNVNRNGDTYIYWAIRKPDGIVGKEIEDADQAFELSLGSGGTGFPDTPYFETKNSNNNNEGFKVDTAWTKKRANGGQSPFHVHARCIDYGGFNSGFGNSANGTGLNSSWAMDYPNGWSEDTSMNSDYISYMWRHHKGHDSFLYKGTGSQQNISHSLGQAPELIVIKAVENGRDWVAYCSPYHGTSSYNFLESQATTTGDNTYFGSGEPLQSTYFTVGTDNDVNQNNYWYFVQMWASVPGISKIGTYTGTGGSWQLDLGFQPRFIWTKGGTSNWTVQDTTNGWLNNQASSRVLTTHDNGDGNTPANLVSYPISTGVQYNNTHYGHVNANGVTYLYFAHA